MSECALVVLALSLPFLVGGSPVAAQWHTPQSDRDLRLTWNAERLKRERQSP